MPPRPPCSVAIVNAAPPGEARDPDDLLIRRPALVAWARALGDAGADAVAVVLRSPRTASIRRDGVAYHFIADPLPRPLGPALWAERAAGAARSAQPTAVHVDGLTFPLLVRHLRLRLPRAIPVLAQDHGGVHAGSPGFRRARWRAVHRLGLRAADGFLFTSRELAAPWLRAGIIDGGRQAIHEVLESTSTLARGDGGGARLPGRPAMLAVWRLDDNKDPLTVLEAFERALPALPEAALSMAFGEDALLAQVRRRIAPPAPLAARVHLLGRRPRSELPSLYASADLFVQASHHESCGVALLEALSFGVTPLVSDIPAFRAITDGGRVGALFPAGDAAALARQMERLGREDLGARRAEIAAHFERALGWRAVGTRAMEAYRAAAVAARGG